MLPLLPVLAVAGAGVGSYMLTREALDFWESTTNRGLVAGAALGYAHGHRQKQS